MNYSAQSLDAFFATYLHRREPLVLATVVSTIGSTYRKPGAQMLIAADGRSAGLLSGGCLETDLMERARAVLETGRATIVEYDSRGSDDLIWGIGLGCEGAMRILLSRITPETDYAPFGWQVRCREADRPGAIAVVIDSRDDAYPLGLAFTSEQATDAPPVVVNALRGLEAAALSDRGQTSVVETASATFLTMQVSLPTRLLVLGAGPDAMPLVEMAGLLDWHVTVLDHRPAYAVPERFPRAQRVSLNPTSALAETLQRERFDAAVVMSHHLLSDEQYLRALAASDIPYVGLLGPAPRRARLMHELGESAHALEGRLHGPIGLDIGANTPETIALAILAEIQAVQTGRAGGSFSLSARRPGIGEEVSRRASVATAKPNGSD